ncbi:hypothetical protein FHW88_000489 [Mucilaginibacter sp. SG538B]|uniref:hypothetical protein n=1 Tax=Mucilaginibacter sp. SG538B TaxID=2587021 RepID=UPI00159CF516|nr:hypothetical protein [Mucilaginibacter sp. SG538B]NVM62213.1 hypothetical protein [Mucilaginibacter sp. SG538B]
MKKTILFTLIYSFLFAVKSESQELLNKNKENIDQYAKHENCSLTFDHIISDAETNPFRMLVYTFSQSEKKKDGIYEITFHLSNDRCFRYLIGYNSNKYKAPLIQKIEGMGSDLQREAGHLIWKNKRKGFEMRIVDTYKGGNPAIKGRISTKFMLVISKI